MNRKNVIRTLTAIAVVLLLGWSFFYFSDDTRGFKPVDEARHSRRFNLHELGQRRLGLTTAVEPPMVPVVMAPPATLPAVAMVASLLMVCAIDEISSTELLVASWMAAKETDRRNPGWKWWEAQDAAKEAAMAPDSYASSHAIQVHVTDELQAANAFDPTITYNKGQAVLRMLEAYLGPDVFRDGVRRYFRSSSAIVCLVCRRSLRSASCRGYYKLLVLRKQLFLRNNLCL